MKKNNIAIFLFIVLAFIACDKKEKPILNRADYFPLEQGAFWIYDVDSISFDGFNGTSDTLNYQTLEEIDTLFIDEVGDTAYRVANFYRLSESSQWVFSHYHYLKQSAYRLEKIEQNVRTIKLIYPIRDLLAWDENELNNQDLQLNRYRNTGAIQKIDGKTYRTLLVDGGEQQDFIFTRKRKELYLEGKGLYQLEHIDKETQNGKTDGFELSKTLLQSGIH